jgi:hypothetical protein
VEGRNDSEVRAALAELHQRRVEVLYLDPVGLLVEQQLGQRSLGHWLRPQEVLMKVVKRSWHKREILLTFVQHHVLLKQRIKLWLIGER